MAKADSLSFPIEALMKVFHRLSVLADLSHSHEVTGVHASLSGCFLSIIIHVEDIGYMNS